MKLGQKGKLTKHATKVLAADQCQLVVGVAVLFGPQVECKFRCLKVCAADTVSWWAKFCLMYQALQKLWTLPLQLNGTRNLWPCYSASVGERQNPQTRGAQSHRLVCLLSGCCLLLS